MTPRLAFGSLRELFLAMTEQRLELLRYVAAHEGLSLRQGAQAVSWDGSDLQADEAAVADLGLFERDQQGFLSAPYDEILIHAGIRACACKSAVGGARSSNASMRQRQLLVLSARA